MSSPFESYDDLEDADERLQAADPAERRVAIIALGHSGDPAAVGHLANMVSDPDAGVRQQVAMAIGEFDGPEAASALVSKCLVRLSLTCRINDHLWEKVSGKRRRPLPATGVDPGAQKALHTRINPCLRKKTLA